MRHDQHRQGRGEAVEQTSTRAGSLALFIPLPAHVTVIALYRPFPPFPALSRPCFLRVQMRMPSPHLLFNRARYVLRAELAPLLSDDDLKREMQHEIPKFVPDLIATI